MAIHFDCPWCTQTISVDDSQARERIECPYCSRPAKVPTKSTHDPPPSPPPLPLQNMEDPQTAGLQSQSRSMPMKSALPLFRLAGIRVYLHFTWFIVAAFDVTRFANRYHNPIWAALEYCTLFGIVLLHEFGHVFACRQTGGQADRIVVRPLGGLAFVKPPARPGAYLCRRSARPPVN